MWCKFGAAVAWLDQCYSLQMGTAMLLFCLGLVALLIAREQHKMHALWAAMFIVANLANLILFFW